MQLKVQIRDASISVKSGNKNGKDWRIAEQHGFAEVNGEIRRLTFRADEKSPYAVGHYILDVTKYIRVSKFGSLELDDRFQLESVSK